ncbi:hypothetical protein [Rhodococcus sp. IEGM 1406]|uniref:hypothetical protein n=1 Tax=Rhodococcus sp. IEGM 1406 TaxID=3047083 RepID=UPI0024B7E940|nr:hypothetical protein [Rhodococcus sp. IEGM 1406]MDI9907996.1 hypothetical protein [Rhodococcus sp. IEGM 1406]
MQLEALGKREDEAATLHWLASRYGDAYSILLLPCDDGSVAHAEELARPVALLRGSDD